MVGWGGEGSCFTNSISNAVNRDLVGSILANMHILLWHVIHLQLATELYVPAKFGVCRLL